ncbi:hypothetical protein H2198_006653 [Neophaeococcomyces mojaviensis]|uniref:Uncharacterized protein n=1 Tax=Neophaeococcomyces mojaviensis TaxID=3383035 RepID=A0ACC3A2X3_9EURO|nr:hypothetical protein H2198_006653 [Knufia sp. JES_112]
MEWVPGSANDKGTFSITRHLYAMTNSAVKVFDYQVANGMKVSNFFTSLRDKKRQNYNMTPTGVGCRFWVLTVFCDWCTAGLITTTNAAEDLANQIQYNYSKDQAPIKLDIHKGQFF